MWVFLIRCRKLIKAINFLFSMEKLEKEDINLEEWEYEFQQRDRHTILMADLWSRALFGNFRKEVALPVGHLDALYTASSKGYTKVSKKKKLMEALRKACEDDRYLEYVHDMTLKRMEEQGELCEEIAGEVKEGISKGEISDLWKKFDKQFMKVMSWYYIPYYVVEDNIISDRVKEGLEKHKEEIEKITDMNNALMVIVSPMKEAEFQKEQREFYELVRKAKTGEDYEKQAEDYLKRYSWMKTFVVLPIEPLSMGELKERVEKALEENSLEEYELQLQKKEKNKKLAEELLGKIKGDEDLMKNIEWARKYGFMLTSSVEQSLMALSKLIPLYKLIAKNLKVDYDKWNHLTSEEIVEILEGRIDLDEKEIEERDIGHAFMSVDGKYKLAIGKEGKEISEWIDGSVGKVDENVKEFKGQSASSGKVKGKVSIVMMANEAGKVEKGDVLVCSMTSPDYVPAMKRAVAIVTDEGGLLCHAAIVGRELGKVVVVGTKVASRVLKDGDLVEVDAEKGVVRILE